jgi:Spy/CpxP family protein refolding chaperone
MKLTSIVLGLAVALAVASTASAQDKAGAKEGRRGQGPGMMMDFSRLQAQLDKLTLTDDQKAKIAAIKKEYEPKLKEARDKADSILTDDQKKARAEAMKKVMESGKRDRGAFKSVEEAIKLTDDQKAKLADARKAMMEVAQQAREKAMSVLTDDQKEQLKKLRGEGRPARRKAADNK